MIIDAILDRAHGKSYTMETMAYIWNEARIFGFTDIQGAFMPVTMQHSYDDVHFINTVRKKALEEYIDKEGYPPSIKDYITIKQWALPDNASLESLLAREKNYLDTWGDKA